MTAFHSLADIASFCATLTPGDPGCAEAVATRQAQLTKPPGSLGLLEELVAWLARWQQRETPRLGRVEVLIFAGNHGVVAQGVSPYPAEVTAQMVQNFGRGGAAINQIAHAVGALLRVIPISLAAPTQDFTQAPAMSEAAFLAAFNQGYFAVSKATDLLCLGEMGIGNTTPAAAIAAALFGGGGADWAGRGTGVDDAGLSRKIAAIDAGLALHRTGAPLEIAARLGGRELAAIAGSVLAARVLHIPVLLDGFVCTAAAAPLAALGDGVLDHVMVGHVSAEQAHRRLLTALGKRPILDLGMRLGEASGAAASVSILRTALACHTGMATFGEASVSSADAASA